MKAASRLTSAVSAAALSAGLIVTGSIAMQMASATVAEAAVVNRIDVRGNSRIDAETVRGYVGVRAGQNFSNADIDEAVKRLFATGLFSDVRISQSGSTLVVTVSEYAVVNQVVFQGNRRLKDADLTRAIQTEQRGAYSDALVQADVEAIRQAYQRIGRDDAVVTTQVSDLGSNRVNVVFNIEEGGRTRIASINFEGNSAYSDRRLRDVISTRQSNILSFITRNDIYDEARLRADEEGLRRFYYDRGYADFYVISGTGELDESTNEYRINFVVDEGARYRFGDVAIESTIAGVDTAALNSLIETRTGSWYSASDVENTIIALTERLAGMGYAFAQVTPRGDRDFSNQTIGVTYAVDEGPRAYVERIEIRGNQRTRDYVIRREFDVSEGDAFNQVLIQRAKKRLDELDYFEQVNISTMPGSEPDQVILVVDLVEKSTGELAIGGGYTTGGGPSAGFSIEGSVAERNFMGRGQSIRLSVAGGLNSRDYMFSFTEPYFLGRRMSAGFDVYRQTRRYDRYESQLTGGTVRVGLPITEALSTQLAYNFTQERYNYRGADCVDAAGNPTPGNINCNLSEVIKDVINNNSRWNKSSVSVGLIYNTIDDLRSPRSGIYSTATGEFAGLGGDARFAKFTARGTAYHTLSDELDLVGLVTVGGGHIHGLGGGGLRVFDLFQSEDRMIRGFAFNGMGPYDAITGDHLGGTTYFNASVEAQFPFPVLPESLGLRGAVFADAATLYGNSLGARFDPAVVNVVGTNAQWRASVGAGVLWASPFGPLRVDYAVPVLKQTGDKVQNFSFGISTRF